MTTRLPTLPTAFVWVSLFLAAPTIWYVHFWVVYLLAEAGCRASGPEEQPGWLIVSTLVLTAAAVALIAWSTRAAWRRWRQGHNHGRTELYFVGALMGPLFILGTLLVGLPVAYLFPC